MAETLTVPSGLTSPEGAVVPLVGVTAEAQIRDYACRVVLTQRFRNAEHQPIEAVYKFPLDEGAAVCGFEVEIDGRRVVGRVEEREKAFETYDEALMAGHGAYLLDEERADVFTASVGNLPPGKEAVLRITTVSELPLEGDEIRFTLPTTIAPRYAPEEDGKGVGETEAERVSPPYDLEVPYGLNLRVDVETSAPVRSVESPSHPVKVVIDGGQATVTLSEREAALDRDVVLKIALAETHRPRAVVERAPDGQAYALLSFRPRFDSRPSAAEVVFVVDRSGSMQGTSIAEAKNALQLALRSLRSGCAFNILGFGSTSQALFPESRPYDDSSLAEATAHVRDMEADLGGTEILPALEKVLGAKARKGLPRQLFVLTDGEVSNTDAVIALARRHAGDTRVFTFGIGAGASHHLVEGLARAGEGEAELIAPGERIEAKVMRQVTRALSPALSDVEVDWGGPGVEPAPFEIPPVFAEGRVLVFGRLEEPGERTVELRATGPDGDVSFSLAIDPSTAAEGTLVGTLWARRAIRDLEEGRSALHPRRGSRQTRGVEGGEARVKAEVVRLGTTWRLVSRYTSFVAVEERETPTEGEAQLRRIPVAITRGWHGLPQVVGRRTGGVSRLLSMAAAWLPEPDAGEDYVVLRAPRVEASSTGHSRWTELIRAQGRDRRRPGSVREAVLATAGRLAKDAVERLRRQRPMAPSPAAGTGHAQATRPVDRVVWLQAADGAWVLTDELAQALGWRDVRQMRQSLGALRGRDEERAAATALALTWLEREAGDSREEWRILAEKGREWLGRMPEGADHWLERARVAWAQRP